MPLERFSVLTGGMLPMTPAEAAARELAKATARQPPAPQTRYRVVVTERDEKGRLAALEIQTVGDSHDRN